MSSVLTEFDYKENFSFINVYFWYIYVFFSKSDTSHHLIGVDVNTNRIFDGI